MLSERCHRPQIIVVVEDEFIVRGHAVIMLEELGFPIADFPTADEALAYLESTPTRSSRFLPTWECRAFSTAQALPGRAI
jgi:hypothetical protein